MNPFKAFAIISTFMLAACDKPTSGQNTTDYRDGQSGATSGTIRKDTPLDSTEDRKSK